MPNINDSRADEIIRRDDRLRSDRANFESHWREISERVLPGFDQVNLGDKRTPGSKVTDKVFNSAPIKANQRWAAGVASMLTPRTQRWHGLKCTDERLNKAPSVRRYLDELLNLLFAVRYAAISQFDAQLNQSYLTAGALGTCCMFVDDVLARGIMYRSLPLQQIAIAEDMNGIVDTTHRTWCPTVRQLGQEFGLNALPEKVRNCVEKEPDHQFEVVHAVAPNADRKHNRRDMAGMPIESMYVLKETRTVLEAGGYNSMPYAVARVNTLPGEVYGRGPGSMSLPDIKMLNEIDKTMIRAAHLTVDPPILLQEDGVLRAFSMRPGALNFGGLDHNGNQLAVPFNTSKNLPIGMDVLDLKTRQVNDSFENTLFQILTENPQMTATEAMIRAQEKGQLLAPSGSRIQSELLGTIIRRELDILARADRLPPMPRELLEAGAEVEIEYTSPINRLQRAEDGVAIMRTLEALSGIAQIEPKVLKVFKPLETAQLLAEINGVPAKILMTEDEMAQSEAEDQANSQAAQLLQAMPVVADSAKNMAQAASSAGMVPGNARELVMP